MNSISAKQQAILKFIVDYIADRGYPPALTDIGLANGMCSAGVMYHIKRLEEAGAIERDHGVARSLRVLSKYHPARPSTLPAKEIVRLYPQAVRMILRAMQFRQMSTLEIKQDVFGGMSDAIALLDLMNAMRERGYIILSSVNEWQITQHGRNYLAGAA